MKTTEVAVTNDNDDKWEAQMRKGGLEMAVLATVWNEPLYGLAMLRELESKSSLVIGEGTLYPMLARMERDGWIEGAWEQSEQGRPRKYYSLTPTGRQRAARMVAMWRSFNQGLDALLCHMETDSDRNPT